MTAETNPGRNWLTVRDTEYALRHGSANLGSLPGLIRELLTTEAWRCFVLPTGERVEPGRFADFVAAKVPRGLETTVSMVKKIIESIEDEGERAELLDLLDRALQRHGGGSTKIILTDDIVHSENDLERPSGNSESAAHRRLRKSAPKLHAEVLAGRLSAHAAMVKAGFRRRTVSVPVDKPDAVARTLRKNLAPEDLAALVQLLAEP